MNSHQRRDLRQDRAVTQMLELADAAAAREDYVNALLWLEKLDARGHRLDRVYESRRERWRLKVEGGRVACSQWFG